MSTIVLNSVKSGPLPPEHIYREMLDNTVNYNARLCYERRQRLPFLDSQTGVAQSHSSLYHPSRHRERGDKQGQIYTYPAKRWKRKYILPLIPNMPDIPIKQNEVETIESAEIQIIQPLEKNLSVPEMEGKEAVAPAAAPTDANYKEEFFEWEDASEPLDSGELEKRKSDSSDYEEAYVKKRAKKKGIEKKSGIKESTPRTPKTPKDSGVGRKKKLDKKKDKDQDVEKNLEKVKNIPAHHKRGMPSHANHRTSKADAKKYCDFCLGDENENKKTGVKEIMVSCADCGRSGHPSCLQFSPNMTISVAKYPWQCIECKSCGLCGTSDNDDQLLFCDDCDRGYHMYCLKPPLTEPPEGSWSCHLCIVEFYGGRKPNNPH